MSVALLSQAPALLVTMCQIIGTPQPLPETRTLTNWKPRKLERNERKTEKNRKTEFRLVGPGLTTIALDKKSGS